MSLTNITSLEEDRVNYFKLVYGVFLQAISKTKLIKYYIQFDCFVICLQFAGDRLFQQMTPAFAHLKTKSVSHPHFTICLWDDVSTATTLPILIRDLLELLHQKTWDFVAPRGEIRNYHDERIYSGIHFNPDNLNLLDQQESLGLFWIEDANKLPYYEQGSPLRMLLAWWLQKHRYQYVHAGAIGKNEQGILMLGKGGSGKSTTTLSCLQDSFSYASDDYCAVSLEPIPTVHSLYNTAKLRQLEELQKFYKLHNKSNLLDIIEAEKSVVFLSNLFAEKIVKKFTLKATLLLSISHHQNAKLQKISPAKALKNFAPSSILQVPYANQDSLTLLSKLLKKIPCYELELSQDFQENVKLIDQLFNDEIS
ncbi:hypothetical protein [Crocosphaera sp.]|uniref:hypothetical protein n=1 Tax=Crocosphaera sp. TaxID=2729996 RepID=UPI00261464DD|nr:hypothetical protein [Crocosphaera sp.]MDJ0581309.1 hypothetical protein [Crocosphaera sp.]